MGHTPGPWRVKVGDSLLQRPYMIESESTGAVIAEVRWDRLLMDDDDEPLDNAHILGTALATYQALSDLVRELNRYSDDEMWARTGDILPNLIAARAALSRAKGQS